MYIIRIYREWKKLSKLIIWRKKKKSMKQPVTTNRLDKLGESVKFKSRKPVTTPCESVKHMVQQYEDNIILPPIEFRDKLMPAPRTKKTQPVPTPRTQITQIEKAIKGFTKSFKISLKTDKDPWVQLQNTRLVIEKLFGKLLNNMKGFKFVETMKVPFMAGEKMIKIYTNPLISTAEHKQ